MILVILKPDCLQRQLDKEVVDVLLNGGLKIEKKDLYTMSVDNAKNLYKEHSDSSTFSDLIAYMTEGPSMFLLLSGENAVTKVARLKGRTGSGLGIRGKYAENFIRNIIHSAETEVKTNKEIGIFFPDYKKEDIMVKRKVIFGLSGMTECGKSTAGVYFDQHEVKRLKIVNLMECIRQNEGSKFNSVNDFVDEMHKQNPKWLRMAFADMLLKKMDEMNIKSCSLESMGDPEMVKYLKERFQEEFVSIYIDATMENRIQYQIIRKNLKESEIEEAKKILLPKDEFKIKFWHMPEIKDIADVIVSNNDSLENFLCRLDLILKKYVV